MAAVLTLYRRLFLQSNSYALRSISCFHQISRSFSSLCLSRNQLIKNNSETYRVKNNLFREVALNPKRYFQISTIVCSDNIVSAPAFPESVNEGEVKWEKKLGDTVRVDEVVCEIETDKTSITVPAPANGVITELFFKDGDTVQAGVKLFRMAVSAESGAPSPPPTPPGSRPPIAVPSPGKPPVVAKPAAARAASPVTTRKDQPTAAGADHPTTPGALVRLPSKDPSKEIVGTRTEYTVKMTRMRLKTAARLKESQNTAAMLTTFNEIDMSAIIEFRKTHQDAFTKKYGIKMGFMSPFIKASVYALQDQPVVNAVIQDNNIIYRDYIDISIAVSAPKGLLVPVIRNVDYMNYGEIEKILNDLGTKARDGKIAIEDMTGGTFTISNGGVFGSLLSTPIINPPQSAILGMHATFERPVAIKGKVVVRPMMYIALTYDHRLIDGREAVHFLRKIKAAVEDPRIILAGI